ncbi:hypothetical protein [Psychroserpens sp.]|uniref:hypothetical protein n=1 Tax=Psychroserpens sp. TaxID=2020870 RepID=UPI002B275C4B|nr:hypothetical protein [Psychroserpens sp.]
MNKLVQHKKIPFTRDLLYKDTKYLFQPLKYCKLPPKFNAPMKKLVFILSLLLLTTCKKDDGGNINNCNFLPSIGVNRTISLNLPQYSQLQFTTNSVYIPNEGVAGIYVINVGGNFRAFDAADPNHVTDTCSFMSANGVLVTCGCADENQYNLLTGFSEGGQLACALQEYRVTANGSELTISN